MEIRTTILLRVKERLTKLSYLNGEKASRKVDLCYQDAVIKIDQVNQSKKHFRITKEIEWISFDMQSSRIYRPKELNFKGRK